MRWSGGCVFLATGLSACAPSNESPTFGTARHAIAVEETIRRSSSNRLAKVTKPAAIQEIGTLTPSNTPSTKPPSGRR
jgi:hypothetical protein